MDPASGGFRSHFRAVVTTLPRRRHRRHRLTTRHVPDRSGRSPAPPRSRTPRASRMIFGNSTPRASSHRRKAAAISSSGSLSKGACRRVSTHSGSSQCSTELPRIPSSGLKASAPPGGDPVISAPPRCSGNGPGCRGSADGSAPAFHLPSRKRRPSLPEAPAPRG